MALAVQSVDLVIGSRQFAVKAADLVLGSRSFAVKSIDLIRNQQIKVGLTRNVVGADGTEYGTDG
jgi:hypothetical protein